MRGGLGCSPGFQALEAGFLQQLAALPAEQQAAAREQLKAVQFLKSLRLMKSASERNLQAASHLQTFFKATSGFLNIARQGMKTILGDEDRSLVLQVLDEILAGK